MEMSFKEFVNAGAFNNTAMMGYDNQFFGIGKSLNLPTPTMQVPTKTLKGNVRRINYTENPISIQLDTGAIWNMTKKQWDYLLAVNKEPKINSQVQIEMFLDGTIKSVNIVDGATSPKRSNTLEQQTDGGNAKSLLGGKSNKPEKLFGKRHMPF